MTQRVVLIGDIHGCLDELKALLNKIGFSKGNQDLRIILLGDLVDRGPDSVGVVRFARENGFELVRGNHDDRYVKYAQVMAWHKNNPGNSLPSWWHRYPDRRKIHEGLSQEDVAWLAGAPTKIFLEPYNIVAVHAGFRPGIPLELQDENTEMHIRFMFDENRHAHLDPKRDYQPPLGSFFWAEKYTGKWDVVYGHHVWDNNSVKIHKSPSGRTCYGIDTGSCFGGFLTGMELALDGNHIFHQVQSSVNKKGSP